MSMTRMLGASAAIVSAMLLLQACGGATQAATDAKDQAGSETILVASGGLPKPHTYVNADGKLDGYDIAVLRAVDRKLDRYTFEYQKVSFDGMLTGLDSDRYQIAANAFSITPEREEKYYASVPYFRDKYGIITPEDRDPITSLKNLGGKTTLATPGVAITDQLEALNKTTLKDNPIQIKYTQQDSSTTYLDLEDHKIDFLLGSESNFDPYTKQLNIHPTFTPLPAKESAGLGLADNVYLYGRNTKGKELKTAVDKALGQLEKDGTLTKLSKQYFDGLDFAPTD